MKKCTTCKELKSFDQFHKDNTTKSGLSFKCNKCSLLRTSKYKKTEQGLISVMYSNQKSNATKRGRPQPEYTKSQFSEWLYQNGFKSLYLKWKRSNYDKQLVPSCDRIDDYKEYTLENIQLLTWKNNREKYYKDVASGRNRKATKSIIAKSIVDGKEKEFYSLAQASRELNICRAGISHNLSGKYTMSGGYIWNYLN